ncbi:type II toxin-antitoxin system VapB family antitoxin [Thermodesulfobacteriota bacterium]
MALVKKTIELDQDTINRIKIALNAKTEKEAINTALKQFDTDIRLADITFKGTGTFDFEAVFED